ncbi:Protein of unknown function (DUF2933) [Litoreibacter halocynthiae]|uniref:DUF2933 family protein n=1 Tax=Litoreibacter halocynthiae TaxID=1242689 RepID=A0A4V3EVF1_9RHOB|nr:DUF2933 domain-containing protein [Litoreibacter halocynthiae]TDT72695.1 Protein of unknown function (DUF2933) [Litoreibacter halocynthiae]
MPNTDTQKSSTPSKVMHYGMIACCAVMLLPVALFFVAGGSIAGLWANVSLFVPIALCVGVHILMFKMMGKSCHGSKKENIEDVAVETEPSKVPIIARELRA